MSENGDIGSSRICRVVSNIDVVTCAKLAQAVPTDPSELQQLQKNRVTTIKKNVLYTVRVPN